MKSAKNRLLKAIFLILVAIMFIGFANQKTVSAEPIRIRFGYSQIPEMSVGQRYQAFADRVNELSSGQVIIELHHSGKLVVETDAARAAMQGNVEMGSTSTGNMAPLTKSYQFMDLPFLFENMEDVIVKIFRGSIGQEIEKELETKLGLKAIMYTPSGQFQQLCNAKREVRIPGDMKGLKIRTRPSPLEVLIVRSIGGLPTPIAWPEVFTSLQQGTVDGLVSQFVWIDTTPVGEFIKYITELNFNCGVQIVYMNLKFWNQLSPEVQNIIAKAADETQALGIRLSVEEESKIIENLKKKGISIYVPTQKEKEQWRESIVKVYDEMKDKIPPEFIKRVQKAVKE